MTIYEMSQEILKNEAAVQTANELLRAGNLSWDEVVQLTYIQHFGK